MSKSTLIGLTSVFLLGLASPILADMFAPSPYCSKPYKPFEFTSQWEVDSFNDEVQSYKSCIEQFVDEQKSAIQNHEQAAEQAIQEWNSFVAYELN